MPKQPKRRPGRPKGAEFTKKVHVPMSPARAEELQQLTIKTGAPSVSAMARSAIKLYLRLFRSQKAGADVVIRREDGTEHVLWVD